MKRFKKILVATETLLERPFVLDAAAAIALHNGASLKIVDVVPDFPWVVRRTMKAHEHMHQLIREDKQERLDALAALIREKGIQVETEVLPGVASVEIVRAVLRGNHDLVLGVAAGNTRGGAGFFGSTGIRLLRQCPCAVWLVAPDTHVRFTHVLGCVDTSTGSDVDAELNDQVVQLASSVSQYHGGRYSILHAWSVLVEQLFRNRMREDEFIKFQKSNEEQARRLLDTFLKSHGEDRHADNAHILKGEAADVIPEFVIRNHVDLVVIGTVGRAGLSGLIIGNTAEQVLSRIECSVLAVKPSSFVSPIGLN